MIKSCHFLGSSSKGNSFLICTEQTAFLIDAGLTGKRILEQLDRLSISIDFISAVFFTHEHIDHSQGVKRLSKYKHIKLYANIQTAHAVNEKYERTFQWTYFRTGECISFFDVDISTFSIPHDAIDPVGFFVKSKNHGKSLCWMTDLGYIPKNAQIYAQQADILILESNYDDILLENDARPKFIKNRIRSEHGHLSNHIANQLLTECSKHAQWEKVFLAHLSRDCNDIEKIQQLIQHPSLQKLNITIVDPNNTHCVGYVCP